MSPSPSLRVLIVDDDEEFAHLLGVRLTARGHTVDVARAAFGLVNTVAGRAGPPDGRAAGPAIDVVVLDVMLPGLSGGAALELLAKDARARAVPVLVCSAVPDRLPYDLIEAHGRAAGRVKDGRFALLAEAIEDLARGGAIVRSETTSADDGTPVR